MCSLCQNIWWVYNLRWGTYYERPISLPETLRATASIKAHLGGHSGEDKMKQIAKPFLVF